MRNQSKRERFDDACKAAWLNLQDRIGFVESLLRNAIRFL
jgi:hypothetical protein